MAIDVEAAVREVKTSAKYHDTYLGTIRLLAEEEARHCKSQKQLIKAIRTRLHHIMAPYLGDPNYTAADAELRAAFASGEQAVQAACLALLNTHDSTAERLPILPTFYHDIFAITGPPTTLLDLACGLNPLSLPFMPTPNLQHFYAYDIHEPRVALLNTFFELSGLPPHARVQEIASQPPTEVGDVALFLKEIPRFDRHYGGQSRQLIEALNVRWLVLSFPAVSLHGGRSLVNHYQTYFEKLLAGLNWPWQRLTYPTELVFIVEKTT